MEATKKEAAIYNSAAAQHLHSVLKDNFIGPRGTRRSTRRSEMPISQDRAMKKISMVQKSSALVGRAIVVSLVMVL